jgi:heme/copper-type cytochrome/quinol oxidase subunit 1
MSQAIETTLTWIAEDYAQILIFCGVCWLLVYPIYKWLMSAKPLVVQTFVTFALVGIGIWYAVWIDQNNFNNGTSGHGYILALVTVPFITGILMNFLVEVAKALKSHSSST